MSEIEAWRTFCRRLEELGETLLGEGTIDDGEFGFEHLADQLVSFISWEVLHADPNRPAFQRHNDLVSQWGGPNADNVYRHARIDPDHRYRITGNMHSCDQFILALRAGFMHNEIWGTQHQVDATDLGYGPGDDVEILLGGPDGIPIPDGVIVASFREYYYDWEPAEPATFTIECLDPDRNAVLPSLDERLRRATSHIDDSMRYWIAYMDDERAARTDNSFAQPVELAKGLANARYLFCFWDLGPTDALVIDCDVPDADYWSMQLYHMGTFELIDPVGRTSAWNHEQMHVAGGRFRAVVSATDPGVANWLDTGGVDVGLCTLRWFWPTSDGAPDPTTTVMPVSEVLATLPDEPRVSAADRDAERLARQRHHQWRFRT